MVKVITIIMLFQKFYIHFITVFPPYLRQIIVCFFMFPNCYNCDNSVFRSSDFHVFRSHNERCILCGKLSSSLFSNIRKRALNGRKPCRDFTVTPSVRYHLIYFRLSSRCIIIAFKS